LSASARVTCAKCIGPPIPIGPRYGDQDSAATVGVEPGRLRRFEHEARAAGSLNHPNVLAVFDLGEHDGAPFIVSELLEGQTLREGLAESPLPQRKALDYAAQIAAGLAAADERGIVHRDLKPDNLFITKDGRIKILDFGLAKLAPVAAAPGSGATLATQAAPLTDAGIVLGTVGYMSPEQVRGRPADHRADIFSFGAILYEMVSGQRRSAAS
jgi:serine/threonine protein kinase